MKKRIILYVTFSFFLASAIEIVSYLWRKSNYLAPEVREKYYIGALLILVFGALELFFLYCLKREVFRMTGKRKRYWSSIVQFIFTVNCIGLPIYLIAFLVNRYCNS